MRSQIQQQERSKIPGTAKSGKKETQRGSTLPDVWMVRRERRAFKVCAFDVNGDAEYANVEYTDFDKACEFAQAANEMVNGGR